MRKKPSRGERLAGRLGIVPVAGEHVRTLGLDLARRLAFRAALDGTGPGGGSWLPGETSRGCLRASLPALPWLSRARPRWSASAGSSLGGCPPGPGRRPAARPPGADPQLDAFDRQAGAVEAGAAGRIEGQDRRGLGQAVAGQHLPAQPLELPGDLRIEPGAARGEQAELGPEPPMQRPEQAASGAPAEPAPAQPDREPEQAPVDLPRTSPARPCTRLSMPFSMAS